MNLPGNAVCCFFPRVIAAEKCSPPTIHVWIHLSKQWRSGSQQNLKSCLTVFWKGCAANIWDGAGLFAVSLLPLPAWRCSGLPFFCLEHPVGHWNHSLSLSLTPDTKRGARPWASFQQQLWNRQSSSPSGTYNSHVRLKILSLPHSDAH